MIWHGKKSISELWVGNKPITAIYKGLRLVWESLASCFGSGTWHSDETWNGDDLWLND